MPSSLTFAHYVGTFGGAIGCLTTAIFAIVRIRSHRQIDKIRRRLIDLGMTNRTIVREWVKQWSIEVEGRPQFNAAKKLLGDEPSREALINALVELAGIPNPPPPKGLFARCVLPIVSLVRLLIPAAITAQSRDTLQTHIDVISQLLGNIRATRTAGETFAVGQENITLFRLLRETHCGEIWLASASDQLDPESSAVTRKPIYRDIHFFTSEKSRKRISDDKHALRKKFEKLAVHSNIVQFFELGFDEEGVPFLVTEHIAGRSLQGWMADNDDERVTLNKNDIMAGLIDALADAHGKQIFHRHLDPDSILLTVPFVAGAKAENVQAKIADFCVSLYIGVFNPTSMYLPPEASQPDEREYAQDDIFALGVIWYQLLIGRSERPPYDFNERLQQEGHDAETIRHLSKCLAHPDRRWENAGELRDAIQNAGPGPEREKKSGGSQPPVDLPPDGYDVSELLLDYLATVK
jgi:hypothetical protein